MSELTPQEMSRGVFAVAEAVLQLKPGLEDVERVLEDKRAELATIEQRIAAAGSYELAQAQHIEEQNATIEDLRSETPKAMQAVQERFGALQAAVNALQDEQARIAYGIQVAHGQARDAQERARYFADLATEYGKIPSVALQRQVEQWQERCQALQDEIQRLRQPPAATEEVPDDRL